MAIRSVPDGDTAWGGDIRSVIARVNDLGDTVGNPIPVGRVGSNSGGTTNFLRADGTFAAPPSAGAGTGLPSSAQTVYAADPPSGSGLSGIAANGTADDAAPLQAALNYVESTWGSGFVRLPKGTIKLNSGITVPEGVQLAGVNQADTILDFSGAGTSAVAITAGGNKTNPLRDLYIKGPNTSNKLGYPTNTCTGLRLHGINCRIDNLTIVGFFYGIDLTENNSFFFYGDNITVGNAGVGLDMNQRASHNGGVVPSENGERMVLTNSIIFNSQVGVDLRGSGVSLFMSGTSVDYCGVHAIVDDAFLFAENCHWETGYAPTDSGNWGSINRYMVKPMNTGRMNFSNCRFEVRDAGVFSLTDTGVGPASYNSGFLRFATCTWYGQMPGTTPGTAPHGESRQYQTKDMIYWGSGDGATKSVYSPFGTKWNTITAYPVSTDATGVPAGHSVRIVNTEVSSVAGATPSQKINLTRELAAGATATTMWVCVEY